MKPLLGMILALAALPAGADPIGLEAVNALRDRKGLSPLSYDGRLAQAAEAHAQDMAANNYFSHQGRDGTDVGRRVAMAGYEWCFVAENIAKGQESIEAAMASWTKSQGHYRNMLDSRAQEMAVVRAEGDAVWVMVLGAPC